MATSSTRRRASLIAAIAGLLALGAAALTLTTGSSRAGVASDGTSTAWEPQSGSFAWLDPAPAPADWRPASTANSGATLFYPPGWKAIPGDKGTVTEAIRDGAGRYIGYLNLTTRQGPEQLHGWATFRTTRNSEDGDRHVRQVAAAEGLPFRHARGSCVIDDYLSKVGSHPYREIACIVSGRRHTDVFIAAALRSDWLTLGPTLERAASSVLQH